VVWVAGIVSDKAFLKFISKLNSPIWGLGGVHRREVGNHKIVG